MVSKNVKRSYATRKIEKSKCKFKIMYYYI